MSIDTASLPHVVTVVWYGSGETDVYGNADTSEMGRRRTRARMWQVASTENTTGQDSTVDQWHVILSDNAVIDAGDRIEWEGRVFTVQGTPDTVYAATDPHHIEAVLKYTGKVTP